MFKSRLITSIWGLALLLMVLGATARLAQAAKPNILLIAVDDLND